MSGFYCDVKPNICMKKDQKVVQRPVPDAYEFSPIPDSSRPTRCGGSRTRVFTIIFVIFHKVECSTSRYFENEQSL